MTPYSPPLEISTQRIRPEDNTLVAEPVLHLPLTDLSDAAPSLRSHIYRSDEVGYPFSNDECTAPYFEQLAVRSETAEYQAATNRVAVLIGESGLAANLKYIPEETIILLDESPDMNIFMDRYVESLRHASNPDEWFDRLEEFGSLRMNALIWRQLDEWIKHDRPHPLMHDNAFNEAQKIARQKTIVTWNADITNSDSLAHLATSLTDRDASITMMNLTNVLPYTETFRDPRECAAQFHGLPLTPNAPIITTGLGRATTTESEENLGGREQWNVVTGPFFGLDNIAVAATQSSEHELGSIAQRNLIRTRAENRATTEELIIRALRHFLGDLAPNVHIGSLDATDLDSFLDSMRRPGHQ